MNQTEVVRELAKIAEPFFRRWHEVESAPRKTCPVCQFESNAFYQSHEAGCPRYVPFMF